MKLDYYKYPVRRLLSNPFKQRIVDTCNELTREYFDPELVQFLDNVIIPMISLEEDDYSKAYKLVNKFIKLIRKEEQYNYLVEVLLNTFTKNTRDRVNKGKHITAEFHAISELLYTCLQQTKFNKLSNITIKSLATDYESMLKKENILDTTLGFTAHHVLGFNAKYDEKLSYINDYRTKRCQIMDTATKYSFMHSMTHGLILSEYKILNVLDTLLQSHRHDFIQVISSGFLAKLSSRIPAFDTQHFQVEGLSFGSVRISDYNINEEEVLLVTLSDGECEYPNYINLTTGVVILTNNWHTDLMCVLFKVFNLDGLEETEYMLNPYTGESNKIVNEKQFKLTPISDLSEVEVQ